MRFYLIIVGVAALLLMVLFGKNPAEESQKAREAGRSRDPLVSAIEEHNAKRSGPQVNPLPGMNQPAPMPPTDGISTAPKAAYPPYMMPNGDTPPNPAPAPTPTDSYYPPPPVPQGVPRSDAVPLENNGEQYLSNGKRVAFSGSRVYTFDGQGRQIPMPDGVYTMYGGQVPLIVRSGRSVLVAN